MSINDAADMSTQMTPVPGANANPGQQELAPFAMERMRRTVRRASNCGIFLTLCLLAVGAVGLFVHEQNFVTARTLLTAAALENEFSGQSDISQTLMNESQGFLNGIDSLMESAGFEMAIHDNRGQLVRGTAPQSPLLAVSHRVPIVVSGSQIGSVTLQHNSMLAIYRLAVVVASGITAIMLFSLYLRNSTFQSLEIIANDSRREAEKLRFTLEHADVGIAFYDQNQKIVTNNCKYYSLFDLEPQKFTRGISLQEIIQARYRAGSFSHPDVDSFLEQQKLWSSTANPTIPRRYISTTKSGRMIESAVFALPDKGWVSTHQDVTEKLLHQKELERLARHDPLTGLENRTALAADLEKSVAKASGDLLAALILLDLDGFKEVNDCYGHPVGDQVLISVANRFRAACGQGETIYRMGGDEFAVLKTGVIEGSDITECATRLINSLDADIDAEGRLFNITASAGILTASHPISALDALKNADIALYEAKSHSRGSFVFFCDKLAQKSFEFLSLKSALPSALKNSETYLHYQPIKCLASGNIVGVEVLLRWQHPQRGVISPQVFIPIAEQTGDIFALSEWTIREACRAAGRWPEPIHLAINISAIQLQRPGLVETILNSLASSGLEPSRLKIEITESSFLDMSEFVSDTLERLSAIGVGLFLDDFGTGYSSLAQVFNLSLDVVKLDRSLVAGIADSAKSMSLARAIVMVTKSIGASVIAEGVETADQYETLKNIGVDYVQGYHIARPMTLDDAEIFMFGKKIAPKASGMRTKMLELLPAASLEANPASHGVSPIDDPIIGAGSAA